MTPNEKRQRIIALKKELKDLEQELYRAESSCNHHFNAPVYDPEKHFVPSDFRLEGKGSDCWTVPTAYREESIPRWSRTCRLCGKIEYTKNEKVVKKEPDFG